MAGELKYFRELLRRCAALRACLRCIAGEEGASLAETALSFLVLIPALIGCFQFSMVFNAYQDVSDAAREASRWASVRGSACSANTPNQTDCNATYDQINSYVQGLAYPGLNSNGLTAATTWYSANSQAATPLNPMSWTACVGQCNTPGNEVQVQVTYPFPLTIAYWQVTTVHLSSTSTMMISQ